jgi:dUTP pyrophosphatase
MAAGVALQVFTLLTFRELFSRITEMSESLQLLDVAIKRVDPTLPLPAYATAGSVGFDLLCREDTEIAPRALGWVPGNVIVRTPPGYVLLVTLRSSTPRRKGLLIPHGLGIIDQDYCGEGDELLIQVYNFLETPALVKRGERIAQGLFLPVARARWQETTALGEGRGGFGSTGF